VPEDVSHVQLDTELFGSAPHGNPRNAELANISVHGPGRLKIQVGDEMRYREEYIASVRSRGGVPVLSGRIKSGD
jgi:hypothetical protein